MRIEDADDGCACVLRPVAAAVVVRALSSWHGSASTQVRDTRSATQAQKGERKPRELAGALGMAWALKSELIRQQRGTCAAHLIRLEGTDSTKSSPAETCSAR